MTPAEARERYGVSVSHATGGDRLTADDGTELVVLESARDGTTAVVHADVVEYDSKLTHPMTTGVVGFLWVLTALVAPLAGGVWVAMDAALGTLPKVGAALGAVAFAFILSNVVLYRTPMGDWLFRFLEWNNHRHLLAARGNA